ncbi:MAG: bifunctional metallophosphatase/5'-nucleotidase [Filimonas sp.]|nr:bifunctional metallophosphatase/5'-nucleotidase [Filimonas sp.]
MRQIITSFVFLITCCSAYAQADTTEIIILSTNDVHGRIDNFSKMAAYVKGLKKIHKNVFVFNAGDLFNGNPVVDEAPQKGYPIFDLMNAVPYTVSCLGNHEFEYGEAILQERINQSSSVYVCANMQVAKQSSLHPLKPYHILHASDGTSIAVMGLTAGSSNPCLVKNISMLSPVKAALQYRHLKDSADVLIALTHIGYKADSTLAMQMKELDVIVGGHSHTEMPNGAMVNGTLITQAGDKLRFIGKTVLKIKQHKIVDKSFTMVDVESMTETDKAVQEKIDTYNTNPVFKTIAGYSTGFSNKEAIGCLKTDALRDTLQLDIVFDHARNISWPAFPEGKISLGDIYEWDSYDYHTMRFDLTPTQLRIVILNSLKGAEVPVLFVSGITYTIQRDENGVTNNIILKHNDVVLNESKSYSVGMNSFIACQFMKGITAHPVEMQITSAEAVTRYLQKHPKVDYLHAKRIFEN